METWKAITIILALGAATAIAIGVSQSLEEEERRTRRKMSRMKYLVLIKSVSADTLKLSENIKKLEKDTEICANRTSCKDEDSQNKMSSYYFFSSSGSKMKNKWDNFKDEEENEQKDDVKKKKSPSIIQIIQSLKDSNVKCRKLTKRIDNIASDMANDRGRSNIGEAKKLKSKRKDVATRLSILEEKCTLSL